MHRKIELVANIAIICVAVLLGIVLVQRYLLPRGAPPAQPGLPPGTKLSIDGLEWHDAGPTLLLVLDRDCRFCSESAPFYRRLVEEAGASHVRVIGLLQQPVAESREYLSALGVPLDDVRQVRLAAIQVRATPTLILVDPGGVVARSWQGRLPAERESEVLALIRRSPASD